MTSPNRAFPRLRHEPTRSGTPVRINAGLSADHEFLLVFATLVFIVGTEIWVRIEDSLLAAHFGESFQKYQRDVPAYIPYRDSQFRETFQQFI